MAECPSVSALLEPVSNAKPIVGSNITMRNPDVEVLAMVLTETPLTMDGYRQLDNGRGWFNMKYMVLSVGPPGFSSVPYTHNKKKGEKEVGRKLYELTEDGSTRFFSYQPGKTNKDRGERAALYTGDDQQECDVTAVLMPGMCLTHFSRSDNYEDGKYIDAVNCGDTLPAYSVVWMQLSSSNCEQASKGRLLKVRKIKVPSDPIDWQQYISDLPGTAARFREVNSVDSNFSIRENIDSRNNAVFHQFPVSKTAFCTHEEDQILLCESRDDMDIALVNKQACAGFLPNATEAQRVKFINVAVATGSVTVLVRSTKQDDNFVMDTSSDKYTDKVIGMHIDLNVMFGLDCLATVDLENLDESLSVVACEKPLNIESRADQNILVWSKMDTWGSLTNAIKPANAMAFSLVTTPSISDNQDALPTTSTFLDRNASGIYHKLRVHMLGNDDMSDFADKIAVEENTQCLMTLEMRVPNRLVGGSCRKRKRPQMEME